MELGQRKKRKLRNPWLVAAWPGMGHVASIAGSHLIEALQPEPAGMIPAREFFSVNHVDVQKGIARSGQLPRSMFFVWRDPQGRRDLIIFVGEAQPPARGYALCQRVIDVAIKQGVERVVTFAAMGTQLHPASSPSVLGAVTQPGLLKELRRHGVSRLAGGQVGGLNGALLAAAAERSLPAMCLLGEMPFYAAAIPNPKSSLAVLDSFSMITGVDLDLSRLERQAQDAEARLIQLLEQLKEQADHVLEEGGEIFEGFHEEPDPPAEKPTRRLDSASRRRIERLFDAAEQDRARAQELKQELDRLKVFDEYEDRFLDLFRG